MVGAKLQYIIESANKGGAWSCDQHAQKANSIERKYTVVHGNSLHIILPIENVDSIFGATLSIA